MILMNDFQEEPEKLKDEMLSAVERVLETGWYVLGKKVDQFEREWSAISGVEYGVGVANGMDAIEIALRSLDIGKGDEVITTNMTAFATVLAIYRSGATPVIADIVSDTALLDIKSVERCITKKTKAVILVHLYGQVKEMNAWTNLCDSYNIKLIEDCAQSHLGSINGQPAGSFGVAGAYSFYPTKNLGASGDAGMLVTSNNDIKSRANIIRNYGQSVRYEHPVLGINSRLDEIQAAILLVRLKWLDKFTQRRKEIAGNYNKYINNKYIQKLQLPDEKDSHVFHLYVINCNNRDKLQKYLELSGIQSLIHYPVPIHKQKPCLNIMKDKNGLDNSVAHSNSCLSLPCHPQMSDEDIKKVIDVVNDFII
jgi:dTDP-4-amino-4,6-dideoxygalactose transaminase